MSRALFSRNADLKRLREEGYLVHVQGSFLVMEEVPYVNTQKQIRTGRLISSLTLAGDDTRPPDTHVIYFDGEFPCNANGVPIQAIAHQTNVLLNLGNGLSARQAFSSKPEGGYADYYQKFTSYAGILSGPAAVLKPDISPRVMRAPDEEEDSVFSYIETASGRAGIAALTEKLATDRVAIIGVGGTGSYVLDLVAKTPVPEIRLFDPDIFLQHNAFRAPGAPSLEELRDAPRKVDYLRGIYARMHRGITVHPVGLDGNSLHLLDGVTFAFLCLDAGEHKRLIVQKLEAIGASFIDVGMGLELTDGSLGGILRVTASTPTKREHVHQGRISFAGGGMEDIYASNIQVADLNALNAALAVIKWKKIRGFYRDLEREYHSTYTTDGNLLVNGDLDDAV